EADLAVASSRAHSDLGDAGRLLDDRIDPEGNLVTLGSGAGALQRALRRRRGASREQRNQHDEGDTAAGRKCSHGGSRWQRACQVSRSRMDEQTGWTRVPLGPFTA